MHLASSLLKAQNAVSDSHTVIILQASQAGQPAQRTAVPVTGSRQAGAMPLPLLCPLQSWHSRGTRPTYKHTARHLQDTGQPTHQTTAADPLKPRLQHLHCQHPSRKRTARVQRLAHRCATPATCTHPLPASMLASQNTPLSIIDTSRPRPPSSFLRPWDYSSLITMVEPRAGPGPRACRWGVPVAHRVAAPCG